MSRLTTFPVLTALLSCSLVFADEPVPIDTPLGPAPQIKEQARNPEREANLAHAPQAQAAAAQGADACRESMAQGYRLEGQARYAEAILSFRSAVAIRRTHAKPRAARAEPG